jgi:hypothetical protein
LGIFDPQSSFLNQQCSFPLVSKPAWADVSAILRAAGTASAVEIRCTAATPAASHRLRAVHRAPAAAHRAESTASPLAHWTHRAHPTAIKLLHPAVLPTTLAKALPTALPTTLHRPESTALLSLTLAEIA